MNARVKLALHPAADKDTLDTSLRYTDILFGFVIRELFLRLQNWSQLNDAVKLHLIVGATLVLGSWIGYRRSVHRSGYQVKFFNLPLFRFLVDQLMLILYFRVAVLTPVPTDASKITFPSESDLASNTTKFVMYVFILYVVWDLLGIWMAKAKGTRPDGKREPLYPDQKVSLAGILITAITMTLLVVLWLLDECLTPNLLFLTTTALLLLYRWAKETRTSWQPPSQA
jgi:hypothetical protein